MASSRKRLLDRAKHVRSLLSFLASLCLSLLIIDIVALISVMSLASFRPLSFVRVLIGYLFSLLFGHLVTKYWSDLAHCHAQRLRKSDSEPKALRIEWFPCWTGHIERFIFTSLIAFSVSGAASFLAAWVAVKAAGGWARLAKEEGDSPYLRAVYMAGLQASAVSVAFGVIGGLIVANGA